MLRDGLHSESRPEASASRKSAGVSSAAARAEDERSRRNSKVESVSVDAVSIPARTTSGAGGIVGRVSRSLAAKVFLLIAGLLVASCLVIYGVIAAVVPGSYDAIAEAYARSSMDGLASDIEGETVEDAFAAILSYCIDNNAFASLSIGGQTISFGFQPEGRQDPAYTFTATVEFSGGQVGRLTVVDASSSGERFGAVFVRLLPPVLAVIVVVAGAAAWLCSRMIARPVVRIEEGARRMSELNLSWRCDDARADEVGSLGRSLNDMAEKLSRTMEELREANDRLVLEAADAQTRERERRDFFAAASHELKTPIAIIESQVEGMMMGIGDFSDHDKHLPQVLEAARRMEALVKDMLALARADSAGEGRGVDRTRLDAREAVAACLGRTRPLAEANGVELVADVGEDPCLIEADAGLLAKALDNLVGNAAVHAPAGSQALVRLKAGVLTIENRSDPIARKDLARLTEPFFRADASRSAKTGGSGLGLYIAQTALDVLGFSLTLTCENGVFTATVALC